VSGSLLDTSVLIAHDPAATLALPETAAISVITLGELRAGVLIAGDEMVAAERGHRLAAVRAAFAALPIDEPVAERYGRVLALARRERRSAKATDLLIVATAMATTRRLYTRHDAQARLADAVGVATSLL
jgi:predicted nucleic acid-binding protein